ncbi:MAG: thioredoxin family protein [Janthinobacterium lividum]
MPSDSIDRSAFETFEMREVSADDIDSVLASTGDALAVVFFWGVDCYNCEVAKKAMLAQPEAIRALGLRWFHANVYEDRALGRRFSLHGIPTWFFFHHGRRLGRATGWHGLAQFSAAVDAAHAKIAAAGETLVSAGS